MIRTVALFAPLLIVANPAAAADEPLYVPVPGWVKPAPAVDLSKLGDDAPVFLIIDQQVRFEDGKVTHYLESATRIASPQILAQAGTLQMAWQPDHGDLMIHSATILRDGETIDLFAGGRKLSVIRREQRLEQMQLDGLLTATMPVEGLRVGDVLRLRFSVTRSDKTLGGQMQASSQLFGDPMRVQFGRVRLVWPDGAAIRFRTYADVVKAEAVRQGDQHAVEIALPLPKMPDMPADAPARYKPALFVDVTSYPDWRAVSAAMAPLYDTKGLIAPDSPLAKEVAAIAAASADPRVRTARALQLVQDKVRYLFNGMAQGNYVPQAPAETWSVRYGDCKAKTLLLLAILHELGIEGEPVLVHSTMGDLVPGRLPMPGAFDHVIVRAQVGGEALWLDGTSSGDRLPDLDNTPPFRNVLPLVAGGADLLPLPLRPRARPDADAEIELDQRAGIQLPANFVAKVTMRGQVVQMMRGASAAVGKAQVDKMVASLIGNYLETTTYTERKLSFDEAEGTAVITARGVAYPDWSRENERFKVTLDNVVQGITFEPDRSRTAWRDIPVSTGQAEHLRVRTTYRLPGTGSGFAFEGDQALPARLAGRLLERKASLAGATLTVEDRVIATGEEVAAADIGAARRELAQAKTRLLRGVAPASAPQRWEEVAAARKSGALKPLLAAYASAIAADPEEALGYTNRAWFHERVFDHAAALRDMDKAIALEPSVDSYLTRAGLHQATGRLDKAVADADAAVELDPGSSGAIYRAISLRGEIGKFDDALEMVDRQIDAGGKEKPEYLALKADLLGQAGRVDDALATLDGAVAANPGNPMLLNSRCWLKGTRNVALDSALKDCTRAIELSDSPTAALDSRAMVYFRMQRLDEAMGDLDAALGNSPDLTASLYLRGVIRKARGQAGADTDLAAARMMSPQIDATYGKWGIKP